MFVKEIQGHVLVEILENEERIFEEFEDAYRSVVETYIASTPIKVQKIEFIRQNDNEISVRFSFDNVPLKYSSGSKEDETYHTTSSTRHDSEIGRALFEFWAKFTVLSFFENKLEVRTKHTEISLFYASKMQAITI